MKYFPIVYLYTLIVTEIHGISNSQKIQVVSKYDKYFVLIEHR